MTLLLIAALVFSLIVRCGVYVRLHYQSWWKSEQPFMIHSIRSIDVSQPLFVVGPQHLAPTLLLAMVDNRISQHSVADERQLLELLERTSAPTRVQIVKALGEPPPLLPQFHILDITTYPSFNAAVYILGRVSAVSRIGR